MPDEPRFLIGYGERLTEPVTVPTGGFEPAMPYDLETARRRLALRVLDAAERAESLPPLACPGDEVVTVLTLHPAFVAKSYFPGSMLRAAGFEPVGSRPAMVQPEAIARRLRYEDGTQEVERLSVDEPRPTTEVFVASTRADLRSWGEHLAGQFDLTREEVALPRVETFRLPGTDERLRLPEEMPDDLALEVVLHASGDASSQFVIRGFGEYAESLDVDADLDRRLHVGGLCFVPVFLHRDQIPDLARFSFLRVARAMPRLRRMQPPTVTRHYEAATAQMPDEPAVDRNLRVAVFDGGLPSGSSLEAWVDAFEFEDMGDEVDEFVDHGQHVCSALLFGSLDPAKPLPRPYSNVDLYRVLDEASVNDPYELYDVLRRIDSVLSQDDYEFVSLSIGPELAVEDDEVHSWTAFLDDLLASGRTLMTIAIGNNGELDRPSGNARVQVPSDCVNGLAIGAASSQDATWERAAYSAFGPGRTPGRVKPDVVAFGGVLREPFLVVDSDKTIAATSGTSFAAPSAMRTALGVRAMFGDRLSPLALKCLLVHTAEPLPGTDATEVGWGRLRSDLDDIVTCEAGCARVVYQGELAPGKYLRAHLPLPAKPIPGMVKIRASLVFATATDPQDPGNYTRSGVEVIFRPDATRFARDGAINARTKPFFSRREYASEEELRRDAHKWETTLHDEHRFRATSLNTPVFDIHYNAREDGHVAHHAPKIRYAMVITVSAPRMPNLYEEVLHTYAAQLEALVPVVELPIIVGT
jgi:hypothetical protein